MSLAPSSYYYQPRIGPGEPAALRARIQVICAEFPRYGYRRVTAQLKAEGHPVNHKRIARLMRNQDLCVRPRRRWDCQEFRVWAMTGRSSPTSPRA